ncbi:MAG: protocatechuate 4,5-dioxygenase subunit alpha [Paracoccaceae bacterium]
MTEKDYDDIPGTFVFDADRSREGYWLNQFCISLRKAENRAAFREDPEAHMAKIAMTEEQKQAVRDRAWNRLLELGGNIYYTSKLASFDRIAFQDLAAEMSHMSREDYRKMMIDGGRSIEGNRSKSEWENK